MPDSDRVIRPATGHDVDPVIALDETTLASPVRRQGLLEAIAEGRMRVVEQDGRLGGYIVLSRWFFEFAFVELLYVNRADRRRGLGRALLQDVAKDASGTKIFTSTNLSNQPMLALLAGEGWERSGLLHGLDEGDPEVFFYYRLAKQD